MLILLYMIPENMGWNIIFLCRREFFGEEVNNRITEYESLLKLWFTEKHRSFDRKLFRLVEVSDLKEHDANGIKESREGLLYNFTVGTLLQKESFLKVQFDKGLLGEFYTYERLKPLDGYKRYLVNLYVPKNDGKPQNWTLFFCMNPVYMYWNPRIIAV